MTHALRQFLEHDFLPMNGYGEADYKRDRNRSVIFRRHAARDVSYLTPARPPNLAYCRLTMVAMR